MVRTPPGLFDTFVSYVLLFVTVAMAIIPSWLARLGVTREEERARARESRADEERELRRDLDADENAFREHSERRAQRPHLLLGTAATGTPWRLTLDDLAGTWLTGATGSGKTRMLGGLVAQLFEFIVGGTALAVIGLDMKGGADGLADLLLRAVAALAARLDTARRRALLERVTVMRFFDGPYLVPWNVLAADNGTDPMVQAGAISEILESVMGRGMGALQQRNLTMTIAVAIEFGLTLLELMWAVVERTTFAALGAQSRSPQVRYFARGFVNESRASVDGLIARIDALLSSPSARAALTGARALFWRSFFEPGRITIIDCGQAPAGSETPARILGALALAEISYATFDSRRVVNATTLVVADEAQLAALTASSVRSLERILTLGRSFGVQLAVANQSVSQLSAEIRSILATNAPVRIVGRSAADDAAAAAEFLPRSGRIRRPRMLGTPRFDGPQFLSEAEESRARIAEVGRLARAHFVVADARPPRFSRIVTAPDFSPPEWSNIDPAIADAVQRGSLGVPREELEAHAHEVEERAARAVEERAEEAPQRGRGGRRASVAPVPDLPDAVGPRTGRGRRGGVP
ncbi:MAG: hypothetical protein U0326_06400 [Polyangiales bacterium]